MYRQFFGLSDLPFKSTPNIHMFFGEASRQAIYEALLYTIKRGDGILKVTGEVGCGKTMLLRKLAENLNDEFQIVYLNSPNLSPRDMLFFVAQELQLHFDSKISKIELLSIVKQKIFDLYSLGKRTVLLVDEAQSIPMDSLEELRLLSNLETAEDKLIQIVFFGQPELDKALNHPSIRQLASRITYSIDLPPFSVKEVQGYLNHRLRLVGYRGLDVFGEKVSKYIHQASAGYPRAINEIADKALMAMYGSGDKFASNKHLKNLSTINAESPRKRWFVFTLVMLFILGCFYFLLDKFPIVFNQTQVEVSESPVKLLEDKISNDENVLQITEVSNVKENGSNEVVLRDSSEEITEPLAVTETINPVVFEVEQQVIADESPLLRQLVSNHNESIKILSNANPQYNIVQLATVALPVVNEQIELLNLDPFVKQNFLLIIEELNDTESFRVKFFLNEFGNYSDLNNAIKKLSKTTQKSQPYIVPVKSLLKNIQRFKISKSTLIRDIDS